MEEGEYVKQFKEPSSSYDLPDLSKMTEGITDMANKASESATNAANEVSNAATSAASSTSGAFSNSNSNFAKAGFVIFIVVAFIVLLQVGTNLVSSFITPSCNKLILGMVSGSNGSITIPQDPNIKNAKTVYRSQNQSGGVEFTWAVWLYFDNGTLSLNKGQYCHVFSKGDQTSTNAGATPSLANAISTASASLPYMINAPGVYIAPDTNRLYIVMNTYESINEHVEIDEIPLNKWFHLILRCTNRQFDVFINGVVTKSMELKGLPKQNYGDVYIGLNNGFLGNLSNLWYYNYALGTKEIFDLLRSGPNTSNADAAMNAISQTFNSYNILNYLSLRWYFGGQGDGYNPTRL